MKCNVLGACLLHLSGYCLENKSNFLLNCILEKVIPKSTSNVLNSTNDIFLKHIPLLTCSQQLNKQKKKNSPITRWPQLEKGYAVQISFRNTKPKSCNVTHKQFNRLKRKLYDLCTNNTWKEIDNRSLILSTSKFKLPLKPKPYFRHEIRPRIEER